MTRNSNATTAATAPAVANRRQPEPSASDRITSSLPLRVKGASPTPDEVRLRAFEIYQARGATPGREREDWEQALKELQQMRHQSKNQ